MAAGVRAETGRYLSSQPWLGHAALAPAVAGVERTAIDALRAIVASSPGRRLHHRPPAPRPVRRLPIQPSATIVGNMSVRKRQRGGGIELSWDTAPNVVEWTIRVGIRADPRRDYLGGEVVTLPAGATSFAVELDEHPRRIQLYGHARDGRIVRRAIVSALTRGNSGAQWKRQASAG